MESIFAARLRAGKQAGESVPADDAKDELVARLEDSTVDSLSELSNIYERVNGSYVDRDREGGTLTIGLTPEGRGVVPVWVKYFSISSLRATTSASKTLPSEQNFSVR
ncbi:hypothetical protein C463_10850 [Halorubrum californiense DSM 19288]|uniref:Uncharacterized protein n=1 Tax=Halorubrum californiense DSM 19288 TaxID=1227465 RepID=M0E3Q7_9EURY|nr:hypothetical protein [Halorubrum californiense]ELZ42406.1 hypothetical protein C463_10850 [Halorubrum californiense DSM 19288]